MSQPAVVASPSRAVDTHARGAVPVDVILAAAGGVLYFLGYVGYGVWPLILVFLVPLWLALERARDAGTLRAFGLGLVFGATGYVGGLLWLWKLVDPFLGGNRVAGLAMWLAYCAWFALGFGVYAVVVQVLRRRGRGMLLAAIPPFLVLEWLQPQIFPLYTGAAMVYAPAIWIQSADLGGPLLLTALVVRTNVAVFETWRWWRGVRPAPRALWVATVVVALVVAAYGFWRIAAVERLIAATAPLRVGIVQANLTVSDKATLGVVTHRRHLEQTRELLAAGDLDLVVWPETAYTRGIRGPLPVAGRPIAGDVTVPLLFGANSVREVNGRKLKTNSAFLIGSDGDIREQYDKNLLIPLAEYLPLASVLPFLGRWFPDAQGFARVDGTPPLHLGEVRIATPICYEVIRPDFVRRMMREGDPQLLVTLANDGWFGDSQEPWIHLALARLRAVEHRRYLVRATNSGVSAIVDPAGRLVARTGLGTGERLRGEVRPLAGSTPYRRLGDWPGWLAAGVLVLALIARRR